MDKELTRALFKEATKSPCHKRKVGAIIVDKEGQIIAQGHNHNTIKGSCEDTKGKTKSTVIHAEIDALNNLDFEHPKHEGSIMFITHPPCLNCSRAIKKAGLTFKVVEEFLKFDKDKLRYELIPTEWSKQLAEILTYGAKKYKPNNWQNIDDLDRYVGAVYRHFEAWRAGEDTDPESGFKHLAHAMTNIGFLLYLTKGGKHD